MCGFKDKFISLFKTINSAWERKEIKPKENQKQKAKIRNPFTIKKEKKIKDRIIRDIGTRFETERKKRKK